MSAASSLPPRTVLPRWREPRLIPILLGAVAAAPASWWIFSRFEEKGLQDPDYLIRPVAMSASTELAIGVSSIVLAAAAAVLVVLLITSRRWSVRWLGVIGPLFAMSAYAGMTYSVMSAPTIGANIGAGLLVLGAAPVALGSIACLVVFCRRPKSASRPPVPSP